MYVLFIYSRIKIKIYNYICKNIQKYSQINANVHMIPKRTKIHKNKSIKLFSRTDQVQDVLFVLFS